MTVLITNPTVVRGIDLLKEKQAKVDEKKREIAEIEHLFNAADFVKIDKNYYRKSALVKIAFSDTVIHARFSSGDIVSINAEQLEALTS